MKFCVFFDSGMILSSVDVVSLIELTNVRIIAKETFLIPLHGTFEKSTINNNLFEDVMTVKS